MDNLNNRNDGGERNNEGGGGEEGNKKSRSLMKTVFLRITIAIVAVFAFLVFVGFYYDDFVNYLRVQRAEQFIEKMEDERNAEIQAMKEDTFGGETPEETLDMLIEALEDGDVELASRYYLPWEQDKKKESYEKRSKEGSLGLSLGYLKGVLEGNKKCDLKSLSNGLDWCSFSYEYITQETSTSTTTISRQEIVVVTPAGFKETRSISLSLNPYTNVWKISR